MNPNSKRYYEYTSYVGETIQQTKNRLRRKRKKNILKRNLGRNIIK